MSSVQAWIFLALFSLLLKWSSLLRRSFPYSHLYPQFTHSYLFITSRVYVEHSDQLPVGLLAQLVEHSTSIAEIMGSNPVQAWFFFRPYFHCCLSSVHYCWECFQINFLKNCSSYYDLHIFTVRKLLIDKLTNTSAGYMLSFQTFVKADWISGALGNDHCKTSQDCFNSYF